MKRALVMLVVFVGALFLAPGALAVEPQKGNTINPMYAGDAAMMAAARATDFWAVDAYENRLDDEVTIASGGSYFVGFRHNLRPDNPYLFGNVGWNLDSLTSISYENQIPGPENNYVGGVHIDVNASAGQTVYLDFYICPKTATPPYVDWGLMTRNYVIKKVIKINIVGGTNTAGGAEGTVAFQKPVPTGCTLSVASRAVSRSYAPSNGAVARAVEITVKRGANGDYPITRNDMTITIDMPGGLAGMASYAAKYVNPYTGAVENHPAEAVNGKLRLRTNHLSTYIIEGYPAEASVPKTGDDAPLAPLAALIALCVLGLAVKRAVCGRKA